MDREFDKKLKKLQREVEEIEEQMDKLEDEITHIRVKLQTAKPAAGRAC